MKIRTNQKLNDEIKRLSRLIRKNENDKRNEVRQKKVQVLKSIKKLNNKLKSKQIKPKQYTIQYKDLSKRLRAYSKKIKITKEDVVDVKGISRAERYASIFNWKNTLGKGIIGAFARGGRLDNVLGFDVGAYWGLPVNNKEIVNKLYNNEQFYDLLDKYFIIGNFTFEEIMTIMSQEKYAIDLEQLFYRDPDDPRFDIDYFESRLTEFLDKIRRDYEEVV